MGKRGISRLTVILLLIVVIAAVIALILFIRKPKIEPYSDNPKTWVSDIGGGIKEVSVEKVSFGQSYFDSTGQQLSTGNISTVFLYDGWFKDSYFKWSFVEGNKTKLAINSFMDPNDGIPEGFIISSLSDGDVFVDVFVDEDWKSSIGEKTNIIWGSNYQNFKKFVFNKISDGIYRDTVKDDISRFSDDFKVRKGGVMVGDISLDNIKNEDFSGAVFIRQY